MAYNLILWDIFKYYGVSSNIMGYIPILWLQFTHVIIDIRKRDKLRYIYIEKKQENKLNNC